MVWYHTRNIFWKYYKSHLFIFKKETEYEKATSLLRKNHFDKIFHLEIAHTSDYRW